MALGDVTKRCFPGYAHQRSGQGWPSSQGPQYSESWSVPGGACMLGFPEGKVRKNRDGLSGTDVL